MSAPSGDSVRGNEPAGPGVYGFDNPGRKNYKRTLERETKEAALTRKSTLALALGAALLALALPSVSGPAAGIRGRIVGPQGAPVPGAYLYLSSPQVLGLHNYHTSGSGRYNISGLMPGTYSLMVEAPGFKTVTVEGIALSSGKTVTVDVRMEPTEIEEEPASARPGPPLDRDSARAGVVIGKDLLSRLPLGRDFSAVLGLVPGLAFDIDSIDLPASLQGAPSFANFLVQDGVPVTHPVDASTMGRINIELIDEVVIESAGHSAEAGPPQIATINVVHRPGAGSTDLGLYYGVSGKGLVDPLWSEAEIAEMPDAAPTSLRREHDLSLSLGGPVLEDMAWFFGNVRFRNQGRRAPFRYWTDPLGVRHFVYDYSARDLSGLFRLSMSVLGKYKGVLEFGFSGLREPVYGPDIAPLRPESSTRELEGDRAFRIRGAGSYAVNQMMRIDLSLGYVKGTTSLALNDAGAAKAQYFDVISQRSWGSGTLNDSDTGSRTIVSGAITRFEDDLLGMQHEIAAGGEYETGYVASSTWKVDNLLHYYADGSPYTFGRTTSPSSGEDVGWGLVGFYIAPGQEGALGLRREIKRIGGFFQDTMKLFGRLSLTAGLRFDRSDTLFGSVAKGSSGNSASVMAGNSLIDPLMGYNPYAAMALPAWDKTIVWNSFSPRFGLVLDLLGRGTTLLKASWASLPEYLALGYCEDLLPIDPRASHGFIWFDEDGDGRVDTSDSYSLLPFDFRVYKSEFYRQAVDPDLTAPKITEWSIGLEQSLARDFTLSARYVNRRHTNVVGNVLYDPSTQVRWMRLEESPEGWWVPFETVVPGSEGHPDFPVTLYLPSTTAPDFFKRIENVPELEAEYRSLEFTVHKRMSHNWQLFGSLVWNRATGTTSLASRWSAGYSTVILNPNSFVNVSAADRLLQDRPLVARLAGTVRFRGNVYASFLLKAQSGAPWGRTVTVIPPADWAAENGAKALPVTINLESPGANRYGSWKNLDIRLEKEFATSGRGRFGISVDVFNLLGDKYRILDLNDGGTWRPDAEGASAGTRVLSGTYNTYWPRWGERVFRINFNLGF